MRLFRFFVLTWCALSTVVSIAQDNREPPIPGAIHHSVKEGETLGTLSRLYGVSPETLRLHNGGKLPDPGGHLWVPPSPQGWTQHEVREGQTWAIIAVGYGIPIQHLRQANHRLSDTLVSGTTLILPRRQKPTWTPPADATPLQAQAERPRRGLEASRSGRPPRSFNWVEVDLPNGQRGWVRTESLVFHPQGESLAMSFGQKLNRSQKESILGIVSHLQRDGFTVQPDDIAIFMALETGGTFSPSVRSQRSGAVGLAQFTDIAIQDLNQRRGPHDKLSKERLAAMTFAEQSLVVADYLSTAFARKKMHGKAITGADLYSAIFAPRAIGAPMDATVYSKAQDAQAYLRNRSLDHDNNGHISKAELVKRLTDWERRGEDLRG